MRSIAQRLRKPILHHISCTRHVQQRAFAFAPLPKDHAEREKRIQADSAMSNSAYPAFRRADNMMEISQLCSKYSQFSRGELETMQENTKITLTGRIMTIRESGRALGFVDVCQNGYKCQLMIQDPAILASIHRGDIIESTGYITKTNSGELTIKVSQLQILAPCLVQLPDYQNANTLPNDPEFKIRNRHIDLLNPKTKWMFARRFEIVQAIRKWLCQKQFLEVETPILASKSGGAVARPFSTILSDSDFSLFLRIAPELYLKTLVAGGFEKVFELGKVFRNEGLDSTHNPEFTSVEFYQAYAETSEFMEMVEELVCHLAVMINNKPIIKIGQLEIVLSRPFRKVDIVSTLESKLGCSLPLVHSGMLLLVGYTENPPNRCLNSNLQDDQARSILIELCNRHKISYTKTSIPSLYDKLIKHFVESDCIQEPVFLIGHPLMLSPLARPDGRRPFVADRFELFLGGHEIANGYAELNDPFMQRNNFDQQAREHCKSNDEELSGFIDNEYVQVLKAGLPPTVGCGIGIDRLVMILLGATHIRDVLLFPLVRPIHE